MISTECQSNKEPSQSSPVHSSQFCRTPEVQALISSWPGRDSRTVSPCAETILRGRHSDTRDWRHESSS